MTWVKICGTTNLADAQLSVACGADALGFIFTASPRQIDPALAAEIVSVFPGEVEKIGVFVNESPARVADIATQVGLTGVQLQGDETAELLPEFRRALGDRKIIKTLQAREPEAAGQDAIAHYAQCGASIDAVLLDSGMVGQRGGTGVPFAWEKALSLAASIQETKPLIIAGGLNGQNVAQALRMFHPWGVDVVTGVERERGKKDEAKLRAFIAAVRQQEPR